MTSSRQGLHGLEIGSAPRQNITSTQKGEKAEEEEEDKTEREREIGVEDPVTIARFLRISFLKNVCKQLVLVFTIKRVVYISEITLPVFGRVDINFKELYMVKCEDKMIQVES